MITKAVKCLECGKLIDLSSTGTLFLSMHFPCCPKCGQDYDSFSLDGSVGDGEGFQVVKVEREPAIWWKPHTWLFPRYRELKNEQV